MNKNILFISDNVRDYIKNLDIKKNISTIAISYDLYDELCTFINKIKKFETIDKKKTIVKLLSHILCDEKYNEIEIKDNFNFFIESLEIIETDPIIKNIIINMKNDLLEIILKYDKNSCKIEINKLLNEYLKDNNFKQIEDKEHSIIKKELLNASPDDRYLFMKYFNYVECLDEQCDNYKISNKENIKSKINIIKDSFGKIELLELFNSKDVQVNLNYGQLSLFENSIFKFKQILQNKIKNISELYSKKFLEQYNNTNTNKNTDNNIKIGGEIWPQNCNTGNCPFAALVVIIASIIGSIIIGILQQIPIFNFLGNLFIDLLNKYNKLPRFNFYGGGIYGVFDIINNKYFNIRFTFNVYGLFLSLKKSIIDSFINKSIHIDSSIKNSLNIYLNLNIMLIMKDIFFFIINFFKYNPKIGGNNINLLGGENKKCFIIPDLKINLLNKFFLIPIDNKKYQNFKECNNNIYIGNKKFILDDYKINNIENNIENNIDCLTKTNLFKNKKINNNIILNNLNENFNNTQNIQITPNILQILKDSSFPSDINYQLGGNIIDEESNKTFINTEFKNIKIQYSYQIINLLKKALFKLNNNGIVLDKNFIKNIEKYIKILSESENELSFFSQKILDVIKISSIYDKKNKITMNDKTLNDYIINHKLLLEKSENIAKKLNNTFIHLINLTNN